VEFTICASPESERHYSNSQLLTSIDLCQIWQNKLISASLQAHQAAWFVTKRSITSTDHHDQFELLKIQMLEDSCVDTHKGSCPSAVLLYW